jgi:hypothetical protein
VIENKQTIAVLHTAVMSLSATTGSLTTAAGTVTITGTPALAGTASTAGMPKTTAVTLEMTRTPPGE